MNIEQTLLEKIRALPPEKQREVLDFAEFLEQRTTPPKKKKGKSLAGRWAKYNIDISEHDIQELRKEMWRKFPRDL